VRLEWASPLWLLLLLALPAIPLLRRRRGAPGVAFPRAGRLARERAGVGGLLAGLPTLLRLLSLALLILALARPRTPGEVVEERTRGIPMVVAIDVSSSMLAQDFRPRDRLEVAKATVGRFLAAREGDPVGLVAFAAEALTVVPVTTYQPVLASALRSLRVGLLEDGTAIGDGLATAVNRLRRVPGESRVVILMSDGESNRGEVDPLQAAQAAAAFGIRVYTIGVGSEGVARVPVQRAETGFQYAELPVGLDEGALRAIAETTGGRYFRATNPRALEGIYQELDRLIQSPVDTRRYVTYTEWYLPLLLAAALLLAGEWLLRGSRWGVVPG